ncbi:MAG TPA: thymidine phosphorylase [Verrucomicrobiae bacterium]
MNCLALIEAKREGHVLSGENIREWIAGVVAGTIPDYQLSALLMAVFFRGLDSAETRTLTLAMRDSGDKLTFPPDPKRPVVDKHSTGGIGDKVSLPLAPLLACLGFRVPMISGRGLGITGGTLDKLESIPGFRTRLTAEEIVKQVQEIGCVICGQSDTMCPADRKLYALRDASGTVPSIPLITASILSKKLSEGIEALVLDVKFGSGAFMPTRDEARTLAQSMTVIANESGVKTRSLLTDMNTPIGEASGNWLEVKESVHCLEGRGPADLRELVLDCAAHLLVLTGKDRALAEARARTEQMLASGAPLQKWKEMLAAQGAGLDAFVAKLAKDHTAPVVAELKALRSGFLAGADARIIGEVIRDLDGGRLTREAKVDFDVGIDQLAALGKPMAAGAPLCRIHARTEVQAKEAVAQVAAAFTISEQPTNRLALITEVL